MKITEVSRRLEQEAMHAAELWGEEGLASKVRACQQLQAVQRGAMRQLAELRVQAQRRGLMSTTAPALDVGEQRRMVNELAHATRAVIESSDAALDAMGAALPDVSERTKELCDWSLSLVEGTRSLVTLGKDVRGVPKLGEAWRKARACRDRPAGSAPRGPAFKNRSSTEEPVRTTKWSTAAQQWAGDARAQGCAAQARAAAEAFERQPPDEQRWQMFHDDGAAHHDWRTPQQKAAAAARKGVAKLRAQQMLIGDATAPAAASAAAPTAAPAPAPVPTAAPAVAPAPAAATPETDDDDEEDDELNMRFLEYALPRASMPAPTLAPAPAPTVDPIPGLLASAQARPGELAAARAVSDRAADVAMRWGIQINPGFRARHGRPEPAATPAPAAAPAAASTSVPAAAAAAAAAATAAATAAKGDTDASPQCAVRASRARNANAVREVGPLQLCTLVPRQPSAPSARPMQGVTGQLS